MPNLDYLFLIHLVYIVSRDIFLLKKIIDHVSPIMGSVTAEISYTTKARNQLSISKSEIVQKS